MSAFDKDINRIWLPMQENRQKQGLSWCNVSLRISSFRKTATGVAKPEKREWLTAVCGEKGIAEDILRLVWKGGTSGQTSQFCKAVQIAGQAVIRNLPARCGAVRK
jgi:hypothetical protein